jgi:hypothetical protein
MPASPAGPCIAIVVARPRFRPNSVVNGAVRRHGIDGAEGRRSWRIVQVLGGVVERVADADDLGFGKIRRDGSAEPRSRRLGVNGRGNTVEQWRWLIVSVSEGPGGRGSIRYGGGTSNVLSGLLAGHFRSAFRLSVAALLVPAVCRVVLGDGVDGNGARLAAGGARLALGSRIGSVRISCARRARAQLERSSDVSES